MNAPRKISIYAKLCTRVKNEYSRKKLFTDAINCAGMRKIVHACEKMCTHTKNCARTRKNVHAHKKLCTHAKMCAYAKNYARTQKKMCTKAKKCAHSFISCEKGGVSCQLIIHLINNSSIMSHCKICNLRVPKGTFGYLLVP